MLAPPPFPGVPAMPPQPPAPPPPPSLPNHRASASSGPCTPTPSPPLPPSPATPLSPCEPSAGAKPSTVKLPHVEALGPEWTIFVPGSPERISPEVGGWSGPGGPGRFISVVTTQLVPLLSQNPPLPPAPPGCPPQALT